ncbi:hypothetical protein N7519_004600 [Penicillium mononematosum]|uniref:uncharacterized protein n=1 Tax=Penicillium mononematosum TaxID=268346 RepID=UPI0025476C31|nr:uncharacterized protein N7519_004600 [Penicillium mononematosum]KAJ6189692.1 hypothetical protein N7519_004600 [Penicillium mononematosum]
MVKRTVKYAGKLLWMKSRHPRAKAAYSVGLVYLVNPKLALHHVNEIEKHVGFHNVKAGCDGGDVLVGSEFGE